MNHHDDKPSNPEIALWELVTCLGTPTQPEGYMEISFMGVAVRALRSKIGFCLETTPEQVASVRKVAGPIRYLQMQPGQPPIPTVLVHEERCVEIVAHWPDLLAVLKRQIALSQEVITEVIEEERLETRFEKVGVPPVEKGYSRTFYSCRTCGRVYYRDYIPYSWNNPIITTACGHGMAQRDFGCDEINVSAAIVALEAMYAAKAGNVATPIPEDDPLLDDLAGHEQTTAHDGTPEGLNRWLEDKS